MMSILDAIRRLLSAPFVHNAEILLALAVIIPFVVGAGAWLLVFQRERDDLQKGKNAQKRKELEQRYAQAPQTPEPEPVTEAWPAFRGTPPNKID
jgi:hypothetical protein